MADFLDELLTHVTNQVPDQNTQEALLGQKVAGLLNKDGFDPQTYLLQDIVGGKKDISVDTSKTEAAIATQVQSMQDLQAQAKTITVDLHGLTTAQSGASAETIQANLAVTDAERTRQIGLEAQLNSILEEERTSLTKNTITATTLSDTYIKQMETANAGNDITFLDFLQDPKAAIQQKSIAKNAKSSAEITAQQLTALDAVNKFQADNTLKQANAIQLQASLRLRENEGLYKQQSMRQAVLQQATLNRTLSVEDAQLLGQTYGLSGNILSGLVSQLNTQISAGNAKAGNIDRSLQAASLQQSLANVKRIQKEAARSEDARVAVNGQLKSAYDALGIKYNDPTTLVDQLAASHELGITNPLQLQLISEHVLGTGINANSIFNSSDPLATHAGLLTQNPELVSPAITSLIANIKSKTKVDSANDDPKKINFLYNEAIKKWYADSAQDYNKVFNQFPGNLHSPSDIPDYQKIDGFPTAAVDTFKLLHTNTTSGESYFQELVTGLASSKDDAEKLALGAAALSKGLRDSTQAATGIAVPKMNIPVIGGDATNPLVWYSKIQTLRAQQAARAKAGSFMIQKELNAGLE